MPRFVFPAAAFLLAAPALAQEEPGTGAPQGIEVTPRLDLHSDYRFRGVSRSDEDPAAQAGLALFDDSGLYGGGRATTLRGNDPFRLRNPAFVDQGDVQIDLYAGYQRSLGGGFDVDAGVMYYVFSGGRGDTDYVEPYASLSYLIGPVQLTGGGKYAPSQTGTGREDMLYLYGRADVTVPFRPWSFSAELGHQDWGRFGGYWTWSLGGRYHVQIDGLPDTEIGLSYIDSSLTSAPGRDAAVVLSLEIGF